MRSIPSKGFKVLFVDTRNIYKFVLIDINVLAVVWTNIHGARVNQSEYKFDLSFVYNSSLYISYFGEKLS